MKLTIVTTTYNQEKYIEEAIEGMLMQKTNFPFRIIISNDCSTDRTKEILDKYKQENPEKIEVINHEHNLGAMGNFIDTLSNIKDTEYVALCDGDDFWTDENKLQKQVNFLDENKDFSICCHKTKVFYQNGEKEEVIIPKDIEDVTTIDDLVEQNYIIANSVVYRWKFNNKNLKEIFPADIAPGDYYLHLLHAQDGKIRMFNDVMSSYRRHCDGMWWTNENDKEKSILDYGRKILNFYNTADKYMNLPENAFYEQRKDLIYNIILTYVKNNKSEDITKEIVSDKDKEIFNACMKDIVNRNIWHLDYLEQREREEIERQRLEKDRIEREEIERQDSLWKKMKRSVRRIIRKFIR